MAPRGPASKRYPSATSPSRVSATQKVSPSSTGSMIVVALMKPRLACPRMSTNCIASVPPNASSDRIRKSV